MWREGAHLPVLIMANNSIITIVITTIIIVLICGAVIARVAFRVEALVIPFFSLAAVSRMPIFARVSPVCLPAEDVAGRRAALPQGALRGGGLPF